MPPDYPGHQVANFYPINLSSIAIGQFPIDLFNRLIHDACFSNDEEVASKAKEVLRGSSCLHRVDPRRTLTAEPGVLSLDSLGGLMTAGLSTSQHHELPSRTEGFQLNHIHQGSAHLPLGMPPSITANPVEHPLTVLPIHLPFGDHLVMGYPPTNPFNDGFLRNNAHFDFSQPPPVDNLREESTSTLIYPTNYQQPVERRLTSTVHSHFQNDQEKCTNNWGPSSLKKAHHHPNYFPSQGSRKL
ncbi:hypothetical protein CPB83DRAFT_834034 [Crepidotus variabilis]|uniref:Uncharacterized protein n=1 Tax=Crepidotus variabilis TaxID=179855 RepID=A0A9P6JSL7_9AGAR|nr:hypothetical protein CPB83DRAFT_834034 [Crepidotus variabilis]